MADIEGLTLKLLLESCEEDKLESFGMLKPQYFSSGYKPVFVQISEFYNIYNKIPNFSDLEVIVRDNGRSTKIKAISLLEMPDNIDLSLCIEALINTYTQSIALEKLDTLLDTITILDSADIKNKIGEIALELEDQTNTDAQTFLMNEMCTFDEAELANRTPIGLNNTFDSHIGGIAPSELILVGGEVGSGKSIMSANIAANQVAIGNVGLYFSIEMRARETMLRFLAIRAGIHHGRLKKNTLNKQEMLLLAKCRAEMFIGAEDLLNDYITDTVSYKKFEERLIRLPLTDNQFIIVDNQQLSLVDIDIGIHKAKTRHGDLLKTVIVDYVNQIAVPDIYDWKVQIGLSKELKNIAEKHDVSIISPYQINDKGVARFSKGLLDAADIALTIKAKEDHMLFDITKMRGASKLKTASGMNWDTLTIDPNDFEIPEETEKGVTLSEPGNELW